ncbi:hypothetical protein [Desulfogranum japonicum]|uniref:hypothetical protein n=1 Tax=Desulfogranum japonicum TaxID=231447 RepID=UPI0004243C8E|nr:hypothetical protein [Desulfogranum japonicum]
MGAEETGEVKDAFAFYLEYVKPLYCEIEAIDNTLPVELLFEIHAAFDHLRRFYVDGEDEAKSTHKAISHLKRGALDAFKIKLKYFNTELESLLTSSADLTLIDSGEFLSNLLRDRYEIIKLGTQARLAESRNDHIDAFGKWSQVSIAINRFCENYLHNSKKLSWAKRKSICLKSKATVIAFLIGCASSFIVSWLMTFSSQH